MGLQINNLTHLWKQEYREATCSRSTPWVADEGANTFALSYIHWSGIKGANI
jgi:hypothetical protein